MDVNLIDLIKEYDQYTADGKTPSHSWLSKLLKELRKSKVKFARTELIRDHRIHMIFDDRFADQTLFWLGVLKYYLKKITLKVSNVMNDC